MNDKMQSAAEKITLTDAVFINELIEPTFINFFYGKNGTGKSTVAKALKSDKNIQWQSGKSAADYDMLVFDTDFINDNFSDYGNLEGVFTVCKTNIEIQKRIDEFNRQKQIKKQRYIIMYNLLGDKQKEKDTALNDYREECWQQTSTLRKIFSAVMTGKKTKAAFAEQILNSVPVNHDYSELETLVNTAFSKDDKRYARYRKASKVTYASLTGCDLMSKSIVSSSETAFSDFIKALNATDWVRHGHMNFTARTDGKCPYCQQKLPENFEQQISDCFDSQYREDIAAITKFQSVYRFEMESVIRTLENNLYETMPELDTELYRLKLKMLRDAVTINLQRIGNKIKEPATIAALEDTDSLLLETGAIIDRLNAKIDERNDIINDIKNKKNKCKKEVWEYLACLLDENVKKYRNKNAQIESETAALIAEMKNIKDEVRKTNAYISELRKQTVNTESAVKGINRIISVSGFQGFRLRSKADIQNTYEVIRPDGSIVEKLSDGERSFIAFLYFYYLAVENKKELKDKIIVIDDPVSCMDRNAMLAVSSLIRKMTDICRSDTENYHIMQMFVLTHNADFYREITYNQDKYYNSVSLYIIHKTDNVSKITACVRQNSFIPSEHENYNPVRSTYDSLWDEYKELKSVNTISGVIRRILKYYFIKTCGYNENDLHKALENNRDKFISIYDSGKTDYIKYNLASVMISYLNDDSAEQDYIDDGTDIEQYRTVFRLIFEIMNHKQHYRMMMNTKDKRNGGF